MCFCSMLNSNAVQVLTWLNIIGTVQTDWGLTTGDIHGGRVRLRLCGDIVILPLWIWRFKHKKSKVHMKIISLSLLFDDIWLSGHKCYASNPSNVSLNKTLYLHCLSPPSWKGYKLILEANSSITCKSCDLLS